MSNTNINGGPAFPCDQIIARDANGHMQGVEVSGPGMTLRDYFAAKAMEVDYTLAKNFTDPDWRYCIALDAYKMADAMLKARETA